MGLVRPALASGGFGIVRHIAPKVLREILPNRR